jgi:ketosteroid isomerase-like protein
MKKTLYALLISVCCAGFKAQAQQAQVQTVINAEQNFSRLVARKGIKEAFLAVAHPEGIVFKPNEVKITDFYSNIDKQPGLLTWTPKFGRISANGDLAFTAGPYVYQKSKNDEDKVYGDYVSIWKTDADNKLKLLIDVGIQHPEPEQQELPDFTEPDTSKHTGPSKDPFSGKSIIISTDKTFNFALTKSTLATYKEFFTPEGRYYFPGFEPMTGIDRTLKFIDNEGISISAETINAGRSSSGDLAYSYGHARIKKGEIVSNYNYVRIWEIDKSHRWNILLEVLSPVEVD